MSHVKILMFLGPQLIPTPLEEWCDELEEAVESET